MEYDRALFRVYERVLEDLTISSSPRAISHAQNGDDLLDFFCCVSCYYSNANFKRKCCGAPDGTTLNNHGGVDFHDDDDDGLELGELRLRPSSSNSDSDSPLPHPPPPPPTPPTPTPTPTPPPTPTRSSTTCSKSCCSRTMNCCAIFGLFQLVCVMVLHLTFVSNGSCLIKVMETRDFSSSQVVTNGTLSPLPSYFLRDDEILNIQIKHSTGKTTSKIYNVSDPSSDYNPTYRFSTSQAVMYLSPTFKDMHEVNHVNITLTDVCLATGEIEVPGAEPQLSAIQSFAISLSNFYGYDTAIINQLMYGMKGMSDFRGFSAGFIQSFRTGEYWSWRPTLMLLGKDLGVVEFLLYKVSELREWVGERVRQTTNSPFQSKPIQFVVVLNAVVAYFLISAATALIVRVLTSSGVVIMFFVFKCLRILGAGAGANDRVLSLSYPWIGREIDRWVGERCEVK